MTEIIEERGVLDHGYVRLLDVMGDDADIDQAARTSYDSRGKGEVRKLLRHLLRSKHTSPFEMAELKFEVKCPMFIGEQILRHRTSNVNKVSGRYTVLPGEMYVPRPDNVWAKQHDEKQGRGGYLTLLQQEDASLEIQEGNNEAYERYECLIAGDIAPELARGNLPANIYTKFVWKNDLHNIMHFLNLRCDHHAQWEMVQYANAMESMISPRFPLSMEAWDDYMFRSHSLSRFAMAAVQDIMKELVVNRYVTSAEDAADIVREKYVPEYLTQREWREDVLPCTEIRF